MATKNTILISMAFSLTAVYTTLCAEPLRHRHYGLAESPPSVDAVELGELAPTSLRSTIRQSYGDAAIARLRVQRLKGYDKWPPIGRIIVPCDARHDQTYDYACQDDPSRIGYGQSFAFTAPYASSPQIFGKDWTRETSVLPPITDLFWAADTTIFNDH